MGDLDTDHLEYIGSTKIQFEKIMESVLLQSAHSLDVAKVQIFQNQEYECNQNIVYDPRRREQIRFFHRQQRAGFGDGQGMQDENAGVQDEKFQQEYEEEVFNKSHGISSGLYTHEIASSPDHRAAADALEALERDQSQEYDAQCSHRHRTLLKILMTGRVSLTFKIDLQTEEALTRMRQVRDRKIYEVKQQLNHYDHLI